MVVDFIFGGRNIFFDFFFWKFNVGGFGTVLELVFGVCNFADFDM